MWRGRSGWGVGGECWQRRTGRSGEGRRRTDGGARDDWLDVDLGQMALSYWPNTGVERYRTITGRSGRSSRRISVGSTFLAGGLRCGLGGLEKRQ